MKVRGSRSKEEDVRLLLSWPCTIDHYVKALSQSSRLDRSVIEYSREGWLQQRESDNDRCAVSNDITRSVIIAARNVDSDFTCNLDPS